jgi:RND family efflux transporter MFP subunit
VTKVTSYQEDSHYFVTKLLFIVKASVARRHQSNGTSLKRKRVFPMNPQARSRLRFWLRSLVFTLLFLGMGVASLSFFRPQETPPAKKKKSVSSYTIPDLSPKKARTSGSLVGFGTARSVKSVELSSEVSGRIVWMAPKLRVGGRVKKGRLLLRIDTRSSWNELKRIKAQLLAVQKQRKLMQKALALDLGNLRRNRRLYRKKMLDLGSLNNKSILYHDRAQRLEAMKQTAANLQYQLVNARLNYNKAFLRAPFDGRITRLQVETGTFVSTGRALFTLESRAAVELPVAFSLRQLSVFRSSEGHLIDLEQLPRYLNQQGRVSVSHNAQPGQIWKGSIVSIGGEVDRKTHTVTLWIRVPLRQQNKAKRQQKPQLPTLLPGTFCKAVISLKAGSFQTAGTPLMKNNKL